jgi:hypothetical protein
LNRATAESSQDTAATEGLAPLMLWVKRLADHVTQDLLGQPDLEFAWGDLTPADPAEQAKIIDTYVRDGVYAVNEARGLLGLDPVPGGDQPMIDGTQGAVPLAAPNVAKVTGLASFRKYNPDEPRVPAGNPDGGQWTAGGDGGGASDNVPGEGDATASDEQQISGIASWYNLVGHQMANGKMFDPNAMNAAMLGVPLGTTVTVKTQGDPSQSIKVTVTDRGPYAPGRVIDLTKGAFQALVGNTHVGLAPVTVYVPRSGR